MGKRRNKQRRRERMNNGYAGLNRHPQSTTERWGGSTKTTSINPVSVENCLGKIKTMFLPPAYNKLEFTPYAWVKINCYINIIGDLEITGLGKIEDGLITDVKLLEQRVKPAFVECDPDAIASFMREIGMREIAKWKLDWHSHVNMATSPSGTDWNNYEVMSELREGQQFPVMIVNKSQSVYCGCYMGKNSTKPITIVKPEATGDITSIVSEEELIAIYEECEADIIAKCSEEKTTYNYTPPATNQNTKSDYEDYDDYYGGYGYSYHYGDQTKLPITKDTPKQNITTLASARPAKQCEWCGELLITNAEYSSGICDCCIAEYDYASPKEKKELLATHSKKKSNTGEPSEGECSLCGKILVTEKEKTDTVCTECIESYLNEQALIKTCRACGAELAYPEEEAQGFCEECMVTQGM